MSKQRCAFCSKRGECRILLIKKCQPDGCKFFRSQAWMKKMRETDLFWKYEKQPADDT